MPGREPGILVKKLGTMPGTILGVPGREPGMKVKELGTVPGMTLGSLAESLA